MPSPGEPRRASARRPSRGPTTRAWTPSCSRRATAATSPTATATGAWRRSSPTSTGAATRSTSPSRTGSTTSTSARSCATRTRSWPPRSTSSAPGAGTGAARWSPTATSTSATTRRSTAFAAWARGRGRCRCSASTTCRARSRSTATRCRERCVLLFGQEGPGLSEEARALSRGGARDPPVRLHPLDQRGRGERRRDARVDPPLGAARSLGALALRVGVLVGTALRRIFPEHAAVNHGGERGW